MALTTNIKVWKILLVLLLILISFFVTLFYFSIIFITLAIGFALILFTEKMIHSYQFKIKAKRKWWRRTVGLMIALFWIGSILFLIQFQVNELSELFSETRQNLDLRDIYDEHREKIPQVLGRPVFTSADVIRTQNFLFNLLGEFTRKTAQIMIVSFLVVPLMFYVYFRQKDHLKHSLINAVPTKFRQTFVRSLNQISEKLRDYFGAKVIESLAIAAICSLGFYVIGIKGWLVLGVIAGFLNIIPYVGPVLGAIPAAISGYLQSESLAIAALVVVGIAQLIDNFYLVPFMIAGKVRLHPLLAAIILLIFAKLFGIMGLVFGIPVYITIKIIITEAYIQLTKLYPDSEMDEIIQS